jgi:hypothetical protein
MLAQPFFMALILARALSWTILPAAVAATALFLLRQSLIVLARQRFVWREPRLETHVARRRTAALLAVLALAGVLLALRWPWPITLALGAGALLMTLAAVWVTVRNRQREVWFQLISSAGLSASSLVACLAARGDLPAWIWWLWALSSAHAWAGVLTVRAHLDARIAARSSSAAPFPGWALAAQLSLLAGAVVCILAARPLLAAPLALSALVHLLDLSRQRSARSLSTPIRLVGRRALILSLAFSLLTVAALW